MTEELEKKAKERANSFLIDLCAYCRECEKKECSHTKDAIFGYKEGYKKGYEQGQEHGLLMHLNIIADDYKKENEELKKAIADKNSEVAELTMLLNRSNVRLAEEQIKNEELKKDKEHLDKVNDEQTEVILKLNEQIEKMKCCQNCNNRVFVGGFDYFRCTTCCVDYDKWELSE